MEFKLKISLISSLYLFAFLHCSNDPIVVDRKAVTIPIVLALIAPEQTGIEAVVIRTVPEVAEIKSIADATVTISGATKQENLSYSNGKYRNENFKINNCEIYELIANFPTGKILAKKTKVPQRVKITNILPGDTILYQEDRFRIPDALDFTGPQITWQGGSGAATFLCFYQFAENFNYLHQREVALPDTCAAAPMITVDLASISKPGLKPVYQANLIVCAIDTNFCQDARRFYNYQELGIVSFFNSNHPEEPPFPGICRRPNEINSNNAIIFGSYTFVTIDVHIALQNTGFYWKNIQ